LTSEIGRAYGTYGGRREVRRGCRWGNLGERDTLRRPRRRWVDNIKVDLKKCKVVRWIDLIVVTNKWRAVVHAVMKSWCPQNARNALTIRGAVNFS